MDRRFGRIRHASNEPDNNSAEAFVHISAVEHAGVGSLQDGQELNCTMAATVVRAGDLPTNGKPLDDLCSNPTTDELAAVKRSASRE